MPRTAETGAGWSRPTELVHKSLLLIGPGDVFPAQSRESPLNRPLHLCVPQLLLIHNAPGCLLLVQVWDDKNSFRTRIYWFIPCLNGRPVRLDPPWTTRMGPQSPCYTQPTGRRRPASRDRSSLPLPGSRSSRAMPSRSQRSCSLYVLLTTKVRRLAKGGSGRPVDLRVQPVHEWFSTYIFHKVRSE